LPETEENFAPVEFEKRNPPAPAVETPHRLDIRIATLWMLVALSFLVIGRAKGGAVGGTIGARKHIDAVQAANDYALLTIF
jgi:hypothetical protein